MMDLLEQAELDASLAAEENGGKNLQQLGQEALDLEVLINSHEEEAKRLKKQLERIMRYSIPQALAEVGIDEFGVGDARIKMEIKVVGSLRNAPNEDEAVAYLEESGFAGAVKSMVALDFTEDEREQAASLLPTLASLTGKHAVLSRSISPQTLMAFARQKLKDDPDWDYAKVGITAFPQAKFTKRK